SPHPNFVPVNPSVSRSTHSKGICGETSTLCRFPLRVNSMAGIGILLKNSRQYKSQTGEMVTVTSSPVFVILRGAMNPNNRGRIIFLLAFVVALARPAFAQVDFTGEWAPLYHEDSPERLPGPELADYLELPINDAARMRAESYDADRISVVQEYQCRP